LVEKFNGYKSMQGGLFLTEEAAIRHEVLESLCEIIPEFQMVRPRLEANLRAIAVAVGPMLDYTRRVPSKGPIVDPSVVGHGELAGTCDCAAGMNGADDHAVSCPSFNPASLPRENWGTPDVRVRDIANCPHYQFCHHEACLDSGVCQNRPVAEETRHAAT
jgi:hypothetical protein